MLSLNGKVALVTGAAGGLGEELCVKLQDLGATVVGVDLWESRTTYSCDISDEEACRKTAAVILSEHGGVDILIHSAGITHFSLASATTARTIRKVMEVNFLGAVNLTSQLLPSLIHRKGAIVVLSSVAGFSPLYGRCGYSASKHALHGYFESLRSEVGEQGVSVMMVCPSFIATQTRTANAKRLETDGTSQPGLATQTVGQPMSAKAVAETILEGLQKRRRFLAPGKIAKLSLAISRICPPFFEYLMVRKIKPEFDD